MKNKKRNVFPNKYRVSYEDYKGKKHTKIIRALTAHEAIVLFRANSDISNKNISAKYIKNKITKKNNSLAGKIAGPSNKYVGYTFHKKRGEGYITFPTKSAARKRGYKIS